MPTETIADLERVPVVECSEPLVDLRVACSNVEVGTRPIYLRSGVAKRLNKAQAWLETQHPGYRLRVGDAYRSPDKQARLFRIALCVSRLFHPFRSRAYVHAAANKYVAATDTLAPPPHTTGGAVDVGLLTPDGKRADMGPFTLAATHADYAHLAPLAHLHREILFRAMEHAGFSNYPEEWWHWSYGDSGWAWRTSQTCACYGSIDVPTHG